MGSTRLKHMILWGRMAGQIDVRPINSSDRGWIISKRPFEGIMLVFTPLWNFQLNSGG